MAKDDKLLVLVDCFALIHRAYHAFPASLVTTSGQQVNAAFGFTSLLLDVLIKFAPGQIVCVFDSEGPTFRHQMFASYKENRGSADTDMLDQLPLIREIIETLEIPLLEVSGFEADDIIGTLATRHETGQGKRTIIVTGDRDLFQMVDEDTSVYLAGRRFSQSKLFDAEDVVAKMGVGPEYIIDLKALEGDSSDNIPGVKGVGKKGAIKLVSEFGHLNDIYQNIEQVNSRYQQKLIDEQEVAQVSRQLATIDCDVPLSFDFEDAKVASEYSAAQLRHLFAEYQFRSLTKKLDRLIEKYGWEEQSLEQQLQIDIPEDGGEIEVWDGQELAEVVYVHVQNLDDEYQVTISNSDQVMTVPTVKMSGFLKLASKNAVTIVGNDLKQLCKHGVAVTASIHDIAIIGSVLSGGEYKPEMPDIVEKFTGHAWDKFSPSQLVSVYQELHAAQIERIQAEADIAAVIDLEMQIIPAVAAMELNGLHFDAEQLDSFAAELEQMIADIQQQVFTEIGHEFNIGSPKQVGEVLFGERGLPGGKKTKSGNYSTNERVLRDLIDADPVVELVLKYRELSKLLSTYVKPLPQYVDKKTGRIHGNFNQLGAVTGRFSSDNPNLQNIPIRDELGRSIRSAFTAAPGKFLVSFDYSQQELRILAELSGEQVLIDAFNTGEDIHATTAANLFDIGLSAVTKDQRRVGKTVNFGIVYGISAYGLADRLKIAKSQAQEFIDKYFAKYPGVKVFFDELLADARQQRYVRTIMGRRKSTAMLKSGNYMARAAAEREIMNFPLQGSAADYMKLAMVEVHELLENFPADIVLQIHDELLIEYDAAGMERLQLLQDEQFMRFVEAVRDEMRSVADLRVKFSVDAELGQNWLEMSEI